MKKKNNRRKQNQSALDPRPPRVTTSISLNHTFVFRSGSAGASSITRADLLNLLVLPYSSAPNTAYRIVSSIRLKRVRAWYMPTTGYTADSFTLRWTSEYGPAKNMLQPDLGTARPGYFSARPPRSSFASMACRTGTSESQELFAMVFPAYTILYLDVQITLPETDIVASTNVTGWGVASFSSYYGRVSVAYLEGPASSTWAPQGITGIN